MAAAKFLPAFLKMDIPSPNSFRNIALLSQQDQALYYHEYVHFLQNVTSTYGIIKNWNSYDRARQLISYVQGMTGDIEIPLVGNVPDEQKNYLTFLKRQEGSYKVKPSWTTQELRNMANSYEITGVELEEDPLIEHILPNIGARHVWLNLSGNGLPNDRYLFGESAISEAMAYLAEKKLYTLPLPEKYPYLVAGDLARRMHLPIAQNEELLFSLCDIAIMHPLPGFAFHQLLDVMSTEGFVPQTGEQVIDYGYEKYRRWGWNVNDQSLVAEQALEHIIEVIYGHPFFEETALWLIFVLKRGQTLRRAEPYFFLQLYKQTQKLSPAFTRIWQWLGGPLCVNNQGQPFLKVPINLEDREQNIHPQHLLITRQINDFLLYGVIGCSLESVCLSLVSPIPVDHRCRTAPWLRAQDLQGCPYAAAWSLYGFRDKQFTIAGVAIQ